MTMTYREFVKAQKRKDKMKAKMSSLRLFDPGQIVATPGALDLMNNNAISPLELLMRHTHGDWGDVDQEDAVANDHSVKDGTRILSSYHIAGETIWVITEADRSASTFLLPEDY